MERAQIKDPHGTVNVTVRPEPVGAATIIQGNDLIRLTREGARELAGDIIACLQPQKEPDPEWTPARRVTLRQAIAKAQTAVERKEAARFGKAESDVLYPAAGAWAEMMDHLDDLARRGEIKPPPEAG